MPSLPGSRPDAIPAVPTPVVPTPGRPPQLGSAGPSMANIFLTIIIIICVFAVVAALMVRFTTLLG
jgi:hypothetical protein